MKRTLIDTGFVVALINSRDENHEKAVKLSLEYEHQPILITDCILLEIGNALSRNFKNEGSLIIEKFLTTDETKVVRLDETLFNKAFELYRNYSDKTWGLVDCVSFVVMNERNITDALTPDKHFVQAGFNALMIDSIH